MKHTVCILCMYIIYIYAQSSLHSVIKPLYYLLDPVIYHIIAVYNSIYLHWYYLSIRIYIYMDVYENEYSHVHSHFNGTNVSDITSIRCNSKNSNR